MRCNFCGKEIQVDKDMTIEGVAAFEIDWGYFSDKDGEKHQFRLCESCYDKITKQFKVPIDVINNVELV